MLVCRTATGDKDYLLSWLHWFPISFQAQFRLSVITARGVCWDEQACYKKLISLSNLKLQYPQSAFIERWLPTAALVKFAPLTLLPSTWGLLKDNNATLFYIVCITGTIRHSLIRTSGTAKIASEKAVVLLCTSSDQEAHPEKRFWQEHKQCSFFWKRKCHSYQKSGFSIKSGEFVTIWTLLLFVFRY